MPKRETLNVSLPAELKHYVGAMVSSGQYGSASEVVRDALRLLSERNRALSGPAAAIAAPDHPR